MFTFEKIHHATRQYMESLYSNLINTMSTLVLNNGYSVNVTRENTFNDCWTIEVYYNGENVTTQLYPDTPSKLTTLSTRQANWIIQEIGRATTPQ